MRSLPAALFFCLLLLPAQAAPAPDAVQSFLQSHAHQAAVHPDHVAPALGPRAKAAARHRGPQKIRTSVAALMASESRARLTDRRAWSRERRSAFTMPLMASGVQGFQGRGMLGGDALGAVGAAAERLADHVGLVRQQGQPVDDDLAGDGLDMDRRLSDGLDGVAHGTPRFVVSPCPHGAAPAEPGEKHPGRRGARYFTRLNHFKFVKYCPLEVLR